MKEELAKGSWLAAVALGQLQDKTALDDLIQKIDYSVDESDPESCLMTFAAIHALGTMKDPRAVGPLVKAMESFEFDLLWLTAWALGEIGDTSAAGPLKKALEKDRFPMAWDAGISITGGLDEDGTDEAVIQFLEYIQDEVTFSESESPVKRALKRPG